MEEAKRLADYFIQFFELKILGKLINDNSLFDLWMNFKGILKEGFRCFIQIIFQ